MVTTFTYRPSWTSMHAISSYRGNRRTPPARCKPTDGTDNNTLRRNRPTPPARPPTRCKHQSHRQDRQQYTAPLQSEISSASWNKNPIRRIRRDEDWRLRFRDRWADGGAAAGTDPPRWRRRSRDPRLRPAWRPVVSCCSWTRCTKPPWGAGCAQVATPATNKAPVTTVLQSM